LEGIKNKFNTLIVSASLTSIVNHAMEIQKICSFTGPDSGDCSGLRITENQQALCVPMVCFSRRQGDICAILHHDLFFRNFMLLAEWDSVSFYLAN